MGRTVANRQGISHCLQSGHPGYCCEEVGLCGGSPTIASCPGGQDTVAGEKDTGEVVVRELEVVEVFPSNFPTKRCRWC